MTTLDETGLWNAYVTAASYIDPEILEEYELDYKRTLASQFVSAREDVLNKQDTWTERLDRALRGRQGYPVDWRLREPFRQWIKNHHQEAFGPLQALWLQNDLQVRERIQGFITELPDGALFDTRELRSGPATVTSLVSTLLMGLDAESYPPYNYTIVNRAYRRTGFGPSDSNLDEAGRYEYELAFLDRFIEEARVRGHSIPNRFYAQSVVWHLEQDLEPELTKAARKLAKSGEFDPSNEPEARDRIDASIARRRGQPEFRNKLLDAYRKCCAITGCDAIEALEAAHIRRYKEADLNEVPNGLLLRADIHTLFDRHLLGVDSDTNKVWIGEQLRRTQYAGLEGTEVSHPRRYKDRPDPDALRGHWEDAKKLGRFN